MRFYAIGDIHGYLAELERAHRLIAADRARVGDAAASVVHLGDLGDRGPDTQGVIDFLLAGMERGEPWITLKGNHDRLMAYFLCRRTPAGSPHAGRLDLVQRGRRRGRDARLLRDRDRPEGTPVPAPCPRPRRGADSAPDLPREPSVEFRDRRPHLRPRRHPPRHPAGRPDRKPIFCGSARNSTTIRATTASWSSTATPRSRR